jgi:hypothetical protein
VRRYFRFGAVNGDQRQLQYEVGENWTVTPPYWISMQHKHQIFEILFKGWGGNLASEAIYVQNVFQDPLAPAPAMDCTAPHFAAGYSPIGALSPLSVFLLTGFIDRNFQSTPPVFIDSFTKPGT